MSKERYFAFGHTDYDHQINQFGTQEELEKWYTELASRKDTVHNYIFVRGVELTMIPVEKVTQHEAMVKE